MLSTLLAVTATTFLSATASGLSPEKVTIEGANECFSQAAFVESVNQLTSATGTTDNIRVVIGSATRISNETGWQTNLLIFEKETVALERTFKAKDCEELKLATAQTVSMFLENPVTLTAPSLPVNKPKTETRSHSRTSLRLGIRSGVNATIATDVRGGFEVMSAHKVFRWHLGVFIGFAAGKTALPNQSISNEVYTAIVETCPIAPTFKNDQISIPVCFSVESGIAVAHRDVGNPASVVSPFVAPALGLGFEYKVTRRLFLAAHTALEVSLVRLRVLDDTGLLFVTPRLSFRAQIGAGVYF